MNIFQEKIVENNGYLLRNTMVKADIVDAYSLK